MTSGIETGCLSDCIREGVADLGSDEWLHPLTARQAQPERSSLGLNLDCKAEERATDSLLGNEIRDLDQQSRFVLQSERVAVGELSDLLDSSKNLFDGSDMLASLGRRDSGHVTGERRYLSVLRVFP